MAHVRRQDGRLSQEMTKDFASNRFFRSDVYIRPVGGEGAAGESPISDVLLGLEKTPAELPDTVDLPDRKVTLTGDRAARLQEQLAFRAMSVAEIRAMADFSAGAGTEIPDLVALMTAGQVMIPFARRGTSEAPPPAGRIRVCPPLNRKLLDAVDSPGSAVVLASPTAGTGVNVTALEGLPASGSGNRRSGYGRGRAVQPARSATQSGRPHDHRCRGDPRGDRPDPADLRSRQAGQARQPGRCGTVRLAASRQEENASPYSRLMTHATSAPVRTSRA